MRKDVNVENLIISWVQIFPDSSDSRPGQPRIWATAPAKEVHQELHLFSVHVEGHCQHGGPGAAGDGHVVSFRIR